MKIFGIDFFCLKKSLKDSFGLNNDNFIDNLISEIQFSILKIYLDLNKSPKTFSKMNNHSFIMRGGKKFKFLKN